MSQYVKKCPECGQKTARKDGVRNNRQRYRCRNCSYRFQNKKRKNLSKEIWYLYTHDKQTYSQIAKKYDRSLVWVQRKTDDHQSDGHFIAPQKTPLIIDAMFWNRYSGVLVFRSPTLKKNLGW